MAALPTPVILMGLGLLLVIVFCGWAMGAISRREAAAARFDLVLEGHRRARIDPLAGRAGLKERVLRSPWLARAAGIFGMRMERIADYKPNWIVILLASLVAGRIGGGIAADVLGDFAVLPATLAIWLLAARLVFAALHRARLEKLFRQFPDVLGQITRAVRVGIPVVEAIRNVTGEAPEPTATEFKALADRLTIGVPLDEALAETAGRTGLAEYNFFATVLALQARTGGGLAETLENLAEVIRKRVALSERGYALAAEARTSAAILIIVPIFTTIMLFVINPAYVMILFTTDSGKLVFGIAVGMLLVGMASMRFLIRKALS